MGMSIDDHIEVLKSYNNGFTAQAGNLQDSIDIAVDIMRKYQKIEDIYYHQSGEALENSLRAVIEDGKID